MSRKVVARMAAVAAMIAVAGCERRATSTSSTSASTSASAAAAARAPVFAEAVLCEDSCLLLVEHPFGEVAGGLYCDRCQARDPMACELDWPSSDVPLCDELERMRNCIDAAYGRAFDEPRWREAFVGKAWYRPDPDFSVARRSKVARANVALLDERVRTKDGCLDREE